ncbi:MAG: ribonucleoside triphosphate reductase [Actinomycetes bacterium]|nr:ribonucleoside triphosphate reductase [Actinomycetes bacterium]
MADTLATCTEEIRQLFGDYLDERDWQIQENANTQKSINGLNNYVREAFTQQYWLDQVYTRAVAAAHRAGDIHLHDLGFFGPYCGGWDLRQLLSDGFGGVPGKIEGGPARHLRSFLGQIVNSTFTTQGEAAGAQAWSSFDTYCAPFLRADNLTDTQVKQALQEFVYNLNVPTRVGFQCPFSNLTFDLTCPPTLRDTPVIIGGTARDSSYGDYQAEMDRFNRLFCQVMLEGDAKGRVFTFPIPTINITPDLDWDSAPVTAFFEIACKYGIPYFSNYLSGDLSPADALSMCCRLRLDTAQLRKRGGGLFGSNPMTGSIGVVTLNLPRAAFRATDTDDFFARLRRLVHLAKESLEIKRHVLETQTARGLYPYSAHYLRNIHARTGRYWYHHFSTIGIIGMNEACQNLLGADHDLTTPPGQRLGIATMDFLRDALANIQRETDHFYNLEATPAEGTSYRLAKLDRAAHPDIICAGDRVPYYTNSTQLPVGYTDDIFRTLDLQDELQTRYTGGTVLHLYLGERVPDPSVAKQLVRTAFSRYKLPYLSLTPTFSVCPDCGYVAGEHFACPECGQDAEVYSRVVGYLRPVRNYNTGKRAEYFDRKKYRLSAPDAA